MTINHYLKKRVIPVGVLLFFLLIPLLLLPDVPVPDAETDPSASDTKKSVLLPPVDGLSCAPNRLDPQRLRLSWKELNAVEYYELLISDQPDFGVGELFETALEIRVSGNETSYRLPSVDSKLFFKIRGVGEGKQGLFGEVMVFNHHYDHLKSESSDLVYKLEWENSSKKKLHVLHTLLAKSHKMNESESNILVASRTKQLAAATSMESELILQCRQISSGKEEFTLLWGKGKVAHQGVIRLVDSSRKDVIAFEFVGAQKKGVFTLALLERNTVAITKA